VLQFFDILKFYWAKYFAKWWKRCVYTCTFLIIIFLLFGKPILRGFGNFLMAEDEIIQADAIFILGGNNYDRSLKAFDLIKQQQAPLIYSLGENVSTDLAILGDEIPDALLVQEFLFDLGLTTNQVIPIVKGTSTMEESEAILAECKSKKYTKIIIVSDKFHLRRINFVFKDKFQKEGIQVLLAGASSSMYDEDKWWQYESGLIMLNNEYIKLVYYWLKGF
jgi:uncharacterized SAM-binding protein YcdF (DUF218 family)